MQDKYHFTPLYEASRHRKKLYGPPELIGPVKCMRKVRKSRHSVAYQFVGQSRLAQLVERVTSNVIAR
jgi:hypothetical protein